MKMSLPRFTNKEKDVDVVIVGTGLPQCILAAALGRAGKSVLHLDPNCVYGGAYSSLNLRQLEAWATDDKPLQCGESWGQQKPAYRYDIAYLPTSSCTKCATDEDVVEGGSKSEEKEKQQCGIESSPAPTESTDAGQTPEQHEKSSTSFSEETPTATPEDAVKTREDEDATATRNEEKSEEHVTFSSTCAMDHSTSRVFVNRKFDYNPYGHCGSSTPEDEGVGKEDTPDEAAIKELKAKGTRFSLDVIPRCLFTNGRFVDLLLQTGVSRYLEFQTLKGNLSLWDRGSNSNSTTSSTTGATKASSIEAKGITTGSGPSSSSSSSSSSSFLRVPCSKAGIFQSKKLSLTEKRSLMKFLNQASSSAFQSEAKLGKDKHEHAKADNVSHGSEEATSTTSFASFLRESTTLSARLQQYIIHIVCMDQGPASAPSDTRRTRSTAAIMSREDGLRRLHRFAEAISLFGTESPFLYPMYGTSDVGQAWTRMGALHEVTFALEIGVERLLFTPKSKEEGDEERFFGILATNGDEVRCKALIAGLELTIAAEEESRTISSLATREACQIFGSSTFPSTTSASTGESYTLRLTWIIRGAPLLENPGFGFCVIPPRDREGDPDSTPIQVLQLDAASGVVPEGYFAIFAAQQFALGTTGTTGEDRNRDCVDLETALCAMEEQVKELLPPSASSSCCKDEERNQDDVERVLQVLLRMRYAQRTTSGSFSASTANASVPFFQMSLPSELFILEKEAEGAERAFRDVMHILEDGNTEAAESALFLQKPKYVAEREDQQRAEAETEYKHILGDVEEALVDVVEEKIIGVDDGTQNKVVEVPPTCSNTEQSSRGLRTEV
ncbi:unnamed protein product [Amoebophrya sp. A25]|nr:unnamed protein product [Amoebophrya sp. A25]|eukprot:GSA25T00023858001.1